MSRRRTAVRATAETRRSDPRRRRLACASRCCPSSAAVCALDRSRGSSQPSAPARSPCLACCSPALHRPRRPPPLVVIYVLLASVASTALMAVLFAERALLASAHRLPRTRDSHLREGVRRSSQRPRAWRIDERSGARQRRERARCTGRWAVEPSASAAPLSTEDRWMVAR